ncbi:uncharacterized protein LOC103717342 [Phoenix dactylifera]|uniref:Uncharacterized protein LOC103717342 n=1 Tax=Phoenix dactylifera TaxID=42345 RepID=A0A8B7CQC6_PHODC|nr:uncharacterized protein LOC103717342 [Phoenix dactylifera]
MEIKHLQMEGGEISPSKKVIEWSISGSKLKIADHYSHGLGVVGTDEIPRRSELVVLPNHAHLRFCRDPESDGGGKGSDSVLRRPGHFNIFGVIFPKFSNQWPIYLTIYRGKLGGSWIGRWPLSCLTRTSFD